MMPFIIKHSGITEYGLYSYQIHIPAVAFCMQISVGIIYRLVAVSFFLLSQMHQNMKIILHSGLVITKLVGMKLASLDNHNINNEL